MNAIHRTSFGHWAHAPLHSDKQEGPIERYLEIDEEARRGGKANVPMAAIATAAVLFPLLLVSIGSLAIYLIQR